MPIHELRTMRQAIEESSFGLKYLALLMAICGAIAVALSVAGIYSVMAYAMSQRTHEIGIRLALGATPRDVLYAMLRQAGTLTAIGVVLAAVFGGGRAASPRRKQILGRQTHCVVSLPTACSAL